MAKTHFRSDVYANKLAVGPSEGGTPISTILAGTVAVDLASMATLTALDKSITITGAVVGDIVIVNPPTTAMTAGMIVGQAHVSATDTVKVRIYNSSAGTIDEASATWSYILIRL